MRLPLLLVASLLAISACNEDAPSGETVTVPSGRTVTFLDVIHNAPGTKGSTMRFRFVSPGLAAGEDASADMAALCETFALPRAAANLPPPEQIIIVLSDRAVPFGETVPEAVQYFEAYSMKDATCIWELL